MPDELANDPSPNPGGHRDVPLRQCRLNRRWQTPLSEDLGQQLLFVSFDSKLYGAKVFPDN